MTKFLTLILLISMTACGQTSKKDESENIDEKNSDMKTLDHANFSIQYPKDWELDQSGQMGTSFFLLAPMDSETDKFKENINLLVQNLAGQNIDLDKYTQISEGQIKTMVTNSTLIESKRMNTELGEFQKIIYSGDQGVFHLKYEQYYWVINDKAYVLTLTCEQDKFAAYMEVGENILNSFILK